jgi:tetratricopeptide (TPR) repeat protein
MMWRLLCSWLAIAPIAMAPVVARAQPAATDKSKVQAARSYVDAGLQAQKLRDYDTAIKLYTKAYELVPHPVLLFNMAQAYRLAGRFEQALTLYQKYLDEDPHGSEARTARDLVAEIEARMDVEARKHETARAAEQARKAERAATADEAARPDDAHRTQEAHGADRPDDHDKQPGEPRTRVAAATTEPEVSAREPRVAGKRPQMRMQIGLGSSVAQRSLTYQLRSGFAPGPPEVTTSAGSARFEAELYPFALANPDSALAGVGLVIGYDKTLGLSLRATDQLDSAPVDQLAFQIGARYRFSAGTASTISIGLDYAHRQYLVDQSNPAVQLDVPDVDYRMIAPTLAARVPVSAAVALFATIDGMLVFDAGPIEDLNNYGKATVYGIAAIGGAEIALGKRISVRVALEYSRIDLAFSGNGVKAINRDGDPMTVDVTGATDSAIGIAATIGVVY